MTPACDSEGAPCRRGHGTGPALPTLIVGLGRSGHGLHLPVLQRARADAASRQLFSPDPVVVFDPRGPDQLPTGTVRATSLAQAAGLTDPSRAVAHLCTPPTVRVEVLTQLARLGFRKVVVEKPLAVDRPHLTEIARVRHRWDLDIAVVSPWRASTLTRRIRQVVDHRELGGLRAISMVQRKPRFTRSLAGSGHRSVFDVEMPHAVDLAMALAGPGHARDAASTDMHIDEVVLPQMGTAWLCLDHDNGVATELFSDLTAPTRERRITLELEGGTLIGHYACSEDDDTAQLTVMVDGHLERTVFSDDALTAFIVQAYQRFAAARPGDDGPMLDAEVVGVLDEAKRRCGGHTTTGPWDISTGKQPAVPAGGSATPAAAHPASSDNGGGPHDGGGNSRRAGGDHAAGTAVIGQPATGLGGPADADPAISFAGIGDEAGDGLAEQLGVLDQLGWAAIELRTVGGVAVADLDDAAFARLAGTLQQRGLRVACVASRIGNWARPVSGDFGRDVDELTILERRCRVLGTHYVRVMSWPNDGLAPGEWRRHVLDRMRRLARQAEQHGLVLVHENCSGWAGTDAQRMLDLLAHVDSPALRLLFDTGNGVAHGYEAYELLTRTVDHVAHVHIKDARHCPDGARYTLPGAGDARVADCLRLLLARGYTGTWSLEPHLAKQPHAGASDGERGTGATGVGSRNAVVTSGHALEQLVRDAVLPTLPDASMGAGGIVRRSGP